MNFEDMHPAEQFMLGDLENADAGRGLPEGLAPVRKALDGLAFAAYEAGAVGETTLGDSADVAEWIAYAMREAEAARNAALNLWPRDCRLCAHFTTKSGGCTSVVQCVDSMQFKATAPRQYWISGPNVRGNLPATRGLKGNDE